MRRALVEKKNDVEEYMIDIEEESERKEKFEEFEELRC